MIISMLSSLKVQQDELLILKEQFLKIDTDLDGTLTDTELKNGLSQLAGLEMLKTNDFDDNNEDHIKKII